jgi:hypothetical protein
MTLSIYHSILGPNMRGPSTTEGWSGSWKGNNSAKQSYRINFADRWLARQQLLGYSFVHVSGDGTRKLRRECPELLTPWAGELFCSQAEVSGYEHWTGRTAYDRNTWSVLPGFPNKDTSGKNQETGELTSSLWRENQYKWATISTTFSAADFVIASDTDIDQPPYNSNEYWRFMSFREDRTANFATVAGGFLYFVVPPVGGEAGETDRARRGVPQGAGKMEMVTTMYLTWNQLCDEAIPRNTLRVATGCTNKMEYLGCEPGTLLLMPHRTTERYMAANGRLHVQLEFVLQHFAPGWRKLLRAEPGTGLVYRMVTIDPTITTEPAPGAAPVDKFLYNEFDFWRLTDMTDTI